MNRETELEMAERHVREAEAHIARQKEIIKELRRNGYPVLESESLLRTFETSLGFHRKHLEDLRRKTKSNAH